MWCDVVRLCCIIFSHPSVASAHCEAGRTLPVVSSARIDEKRTKYRRTREITLVAWVSSTVNIGLMRMFSLFAKHVASHAAARDASSDWY